MEPLLDAIALEEEPIVETTPQNNVAAPEPASTIPFEERYRNFIDEISKHHFLRMERRKIKELPEQLFTIPRIQDDLDVLYLQQNEIEVIPRTMMQSKNLKVIDLSMNKIQGNFYDILNYCMPPSIIGLDLSRNQIFISSSPRKSTSSSESNLREMTNRSSQTKLRPLNLMILKLNNNPLHSIPVLPFSNLTQLELANIGIENLASNFFESLPELIYLDLSDNSLQYLPPSIIRLKRLKTLLCKRNDLISIFAPEENTHTNLIDYFLMDLEENNAVDEKDKKKSISGIDFVHEKSKKVTLKQKMNLLYSFATSEQIYSEQEDSMNIIQQMKIFFCCLSRLNTLDLSYNQLLAHTMITIGSLRYVEAINFSNNRFVALPSKELLQWTEKPHPDTKITRLNLSSNQLSQFPVELDMLANYRTFESLDLSNNLINGFAPSIQTFVYLKKLNLSRNAITKIPEYINKMTLLEHLDLTNNHLQSIPDEAFVNLRSLKILFLNFNLLKRIPKTISQCVNLEKLCARSNQIKTIPTEIFMGCGNLTYLDMGCNRIKRIPNTIIHAKKLRVLNVSNNMISTVPRELYTLPLLYLNCKRNVCFEAHETQMKEIRKMLEKLEQEMIAKRHKQKEPSKEKETSNNKEQSSAANEK